MSIKIMNEIWKLSGMTQAEKLVLLCLADNANNDGVCWPSVQDIADRSVCDPRSVFRVINSLQEKGYISRESRSGKSTVYHIKTPDIKTGVSHNSTPDIKSPHTPDIKSDDNMSPLTLSTVTPDPVSGGDDIKSGVPSYRSGTRDLTINEPSRTVNTRSAQDILFEENKNGKSEEPAPDFSVKDFYEFWKVYPSKIAKDAALRKFKEVVKRGIHPQTLIDGAIAYAKTEKVKKGIVCNPATWLHQGRWTDVYQEKVPENTEKETDIGMARSFAGMRDSITKALSVGNTSRAGFWQNLFTDEKRAWLEAYESKHGTVTAGNQA
jgi:hypothetical protein